MASVQFNLLPDVKLDYIRSQRSKNLVMTISFIAAAAAIGIFLLVFLSVEGVQKKQLNDSQKEIAAASTQLNSITNLSQILTVQNQLQTLTNLHHQKEINSRLFSYLPQLTPVNASINSLTTDLATGTLKIAGTADAQTTVNTFVDTLKFTTYKVGQQDSAHPAFSSVVESSFSISASGVNYSLDVTFDPTLFSNNLPSAPVLSVPKLTTTRSVTEDPSNTLFTQSQSTSSTSNSGKGQ